MRSSGSKSQTATPTLPRGNVMMEAGIKCTREILIEPLADLLPVPANHSDPMLIVRSRRYRTNFFTGDVLSVA